MQVPALVVKRVVCAGAMPVMVSGPPLLLATMKVRGPTVVPPGALPKFDGVGVTVRLSGGTEPPYSQKSTVPPGAPTTWSRPRRHWLSEPTGGLKRTEMAHVAPAASGPVQVDPVIV